MEYILLSVYCVLTAVHLYLLRLCFYILATKKLNILNTAHSILLFCIAVPTILGNLLIISSVASNGDIDASFIVELMDFSFILTFNTLFIHLFQYRSTLLYKGVSPRFYEYIYHVLEFKAIITPALYVFGLIISSGLKSSITTFLIVFQLLLALGNVIMYLFLKRKFETLNIIQSHGNSNIANQAESVVSIHIFPVEKNNKNNNNPSTKRSVKEIYEEIKLDIYNNLRLSIITMTLFIIISVILLVIFNNKASSDQYYLSISYRLVFVIPIVVCSKPIIKACAEKRKKAANNSHLTNPDDANDNDD